MADGPSIERSLLARDREQLVRKLVREAPYEKYAYVRQLLAEARAGKIDHEVFKEVVRRIDAFSVVEEINNWENYQRK